jgi:hypothetical protein
VSVPVLSKTTTLTCSNPSETYMLLLMPLLPMSSVPEGNNFGPGQLCDTYEDTNATAFTLQFRGMHVHNFHRPMSMLQQGPDCCLSGP